MTQHALLVDYEYCTGCHSCEIACRNEKQLPLGQHGIKLTEVGPFELNNKKIEWNYLPMTTSLCDLCADRVARKEEPSCVHHCLASCLKYGTLDELKKDMAKKGKKMYMVMP